MEIKKVSEKEKNEFNKVSIHPLQSWEWGDFRENAGNKIVRLGVYQNKKLVHAIQVVFSRIPKTKFKIGTVIKGPAPTKEVIKALKDLAEEENAIFIKPEPNLAKNPSGKVNLDNVIKLLKNSGCVPGKTLFTPTTFWIDLSPSEESLLASFHPKTRYNIRLAQKKGVVVEEDNSDKAFEKYLELTQETIERQGFYSHTKKYHQLMWHYLRQLPLSKNQTPTARLLTAKYKGEIITTWILFVWHDFLYYPYGASTDKQKDVMANNLMMWEAIKYGKKLGLTTFDLWGREEGKGFTKFKEGYSPVVVEFAGTWDLPTSKIYPIYKLAEKLRWSFLKTKSKFVKPAF